MTQPTRKKQPLPVTLLMLVGACFAFVAAFLAFQRNSAAMIPGVAALVFYAAAAIAAAVAKKKNKEA